MKCRFMFSSTFHILRSTFFPFFCSFAIIINNDSAVKSVDNFAIYAGNTSFVFKVVPYVLCCTYYVQAHYFI